MKNKSIIILIFLIAESCNNNSYESKKLKEACNNSYKHKSSCNITYEYKKIEENCNKIYESEELKAIEDIANDYLIRKDLDKILNRGEFNDEDNINKINIDKLCIKVYVSDALMPISQIKEDNEWMFKNNNCSTSDSLIFYRIKNSKMFKKLKYANIDKSHIMLTKPYTQINTSDINIKEDEEYKILKFSRVCFDEKKENGIVVIEFSVGYEVGIGLRFNGPLLIKKVHDKWKFVELN